MGKFNLPAPEEFCFAKFFPKISARAERISLMPFLCLVAKKWRKKRRPDFPSGASLGARQNCRRSRTSNVLAKIERALALHFVECSVCPLQRILQSKILPLVS